MILSDDNYFGICDIGGYGDNGGYRDNDDDNNVDSYENADISSEDNNYEDCVENSVSNLKNVLQ